MCTNVQTNTLSAVSAPHMNGKIVNNTRIATNITKYLFFVTIIRCECVWEYLVTVCMYYTYLLCARIIKHWIVFFLCSVVFSTRFHTQMYIIIYYTNKREWLCGCLFSSLIYVRYFLFCSLRLFLVFVPLFASFNKGSSATNQQQ